MGSRSGVADAQFLNEVPLADTKDPRESLQTLRHLCIFERHCAPCGRCHSGGVTAILIHSDPRLNAHIYTNGMWKIATPADVQCSFSIPEGFLLNERIGTDDILRFNAVLIAGGS